MTTLHRLSKSSLLMKLRFLKSQSSFCRHSSSASASSSYTAVNEPMLDYMPDSAERAQVQASLKKLSSRISDVPIVIGDREIRNKQHKHQLVPFDHQTKLAKLYLSDQETIQSAIDDCLEARPGWEALSLDQRADIFLKAADLISGQYRADIVAATMLGQGKTVWQAEIDAAAELADFLRFNVQFAYEVTRYQPISTKAAKNSMIYRGLEGFVAAVSPFNFTAIGGNLATAPAIMGNVVVWKCSETATLSNYLVYQALREAGLPPGVINFVPSEGRTFGESVVKSRHLAGLNFTGSVPTFNWLWQKMGENLPNYRNYPRLVGEVGGKNFHLVHTSADIDHVVNNTIRAAFEYSGQKCSACSRLYVPREIWPAIREKLTAEIGRIKLGTPLEFDTFMSAVIDEKSFKRIKGYLDHARSSNNCKIIVGGKADDSQGYFIEPTVVQVSDPHDKMMREEIFGPVLAVFVYEGAEIEQTLQLINHSTDFALTGAIFAEDNEVLKDWQQKLRYAAGNFYINDKSTGAVVGQQPFGGARHSGTNDKAGSPAYLLRWTSPQAVKEGISPLKDWRYPHMQ